MKGIVSLSSVLKIFEPDFTYSLFKGLECFGDTGSQTNKWASFKLPPSSKSTQLNEDVHFAMVHEGLRKACVTLIDSYSWYTLLL